MKSSLDETCSLINYAQPFTKGWKNRRGDKKETNWKIWQLFLTLTSFEIQICNFLKGMERHVFWSAKPSTSLSLNDRSFTIFLSLTHSHCQQFLNKKLFILQIQSVGKIYHQWMNKTWFVLSSAIRKKFLSSSEVLVKKKRKIYRIWMKILRGKNYSSKQRI